VAFEGVAFAGVISSEGGVPLAGRCPVALAGADFAGVALAGAPLAGVDSAVEEDLPPGVALLGVAFAGAVLAGVAFAGAALGAEAFAGAAFSGAAIGRPVVSCVLGSALAEAAFREVRGAVSPGRAEAGSSGLGEVGLPGLAGVESGLAEVGLPGLAEVESPGRGGLIFTIGGESGGGATVDR
jgi:hypothetical protein